MDHNPVSFLRSLVVNALEVQAQEAKDGDWWEVDLIMVVIGGSFLSGFWALLNL